MRPHRLTVRTAGSHPVNRSSILRGVTNKNIQRKLDVFVCIRGWVGAGILVFETNHDYDDQIASMEYWRGNNSKQRR